MLVVLKYLLIIILLPAVVSSEIKSYFSPIVKLFLHLQVILNKKNMLKQFLNQPFPLSGSKWRLIIAISLFIGLFMLFFSPFGIASLQSKNIILICAGYGLVTFVVLVIDLFKGINAKGLHTFICEGYNFIATKTPQLYEIIYWAGNKPIIAKGSFDITRRLSQKKIKEFSP